MVSQNPAASQNSSYDVIVLLNKCVKEAIRGNMRETLALLSLTTTYSWSFMYSPNNQTPGLPSPRFLFVLRVGSFTYLFLAIYLLFEWNFLLLPLYILPVLGLCAKRPCRVLFLLNCMNILKCLQTSYYFDILKCLFRFILFI